MASFEQTVSAPPPATAQPSGLGAEATAGATAASTAAASSSSPTEATTTPTAASASGGEQAQPKGRKIIVHHLDDSRSQRILWLLEELGVDYEIRYYKRQPTKQAPAELKNVHPLGKAPVITDGEVTLAESGAIVEYLIKKYGKGRFDPPDTEKGWVNNLYYNHYAEGTLMPILVMSLVMTLIPDRAPFIVRPVARAICNTVNSNLVMPQLKDNARMLETHLSSSPTGWFAGGPNPTSADFLMSFPCETLLARGGQGVGDVPNIKKFVERVHAREAYKRGLEKGGKYAYA